MVKLSSLRRRILFMPHASQTYELLAVITEQGERKMGPLNVTTPSFTSSGNVAIHMAEPGPHSTSERLLPVQHQRCQMMTSTSLACYKL